MTIITGTRVIGYLRMMYGRKNGG